MTPLDVVAGTGHRPQHLLPEQRAWLRERIPAAVTWLVEQAGMRVGISGLALGFDTWWAEALLARRASHGDVQVWGYAPCPQQPARWSSTDKKRWTVLVERCDRIVMVADRYHETCMNDRNAAMLADATGLLAGWRSLKRSGGTWDAIKGARSRRMPGVLLDADHRRTRLIEYPQGVLPLDAPARVA